MKRIGTLVLAVALLALCAAPAMARSVGVEVDGKVYTFCEDGEGDARYEVDGKTFYVSEDEVIVQEPGKPDRQLILTKEASADATAEAGSAGDAAEYVSQTIVTVAEAEDGDDAQAWGAEYAAYAPYGLSCDAATGKLYYMGKPVRVFEDAYGVDGGTAELSYFDAAGTVDVRALRDAKGELIGLEPLSEAEFESRDLREWTNPEPTRLEATTEGSEPTPGERAAFFAPYAPFGLRYDAKEGKLYLNDRPVRNFLDVRSSNGENPTGGNFHGSMTQLRFDGEVDVTVIRDYSQADDSGEGKIIGLEITEVQEP